MSSHPLPNDAGLRALIAPHVGREGALLPVLHALQHAHGHVPAAALPLIAEMLGLSQAEVLGVLSFYPDFRTQPGGRHRLQVCRAESCLALGGEALAQSARTLLGADWGGCSADGEFTLEAVYCLGNCAASPAVRIDDDIHGRVSPASLADLLAETRQGAADTACPATPEVQA